MKRLWLILHLNMGVKIAEGQGKKNRTHKKLQQADSIYYLSERAEYFIRVHHVGTSAN